MKITTHSLLLALIAVAGLNVPLRGQPVQPPTPSGGSDLKRSGTIDDKMFPDGVFHEFGTVKHGTRVRHTFRIVNATDAPLNIAVRGGLGSAGCLVARPNKRVFQPHEEGDVDVTIDTGCFLGTKTLTVYVVDISKFIEHRLWVSATSREELPCFPDNFDFGRITKGNALTRHMIVAVPDEPNLQNDISRVLMPLRFSLWVKNVSIGKTGRNPDTARVSRSQCDSAALPSASNHIQLLSLMRLVNKLRQFGLICCSEVPPSRGEAFASCLNVGFHKELPVNHSLIRA